MEKQGDHTREQEFEMEKQHNHTRAGVRATWLAYAALLLLSVPWYFPEGRGETLVLGFPVWCFTSLVCYVLVALLTAWRIDALWTTQAPQEDWAQD